MIDLAYITKRHEMSARPYPGRAVHVCLECWQVWPCDATKLVAEVTRVTQLGRALMTEYHATMGCDPDCIARYHSTLPELPAHEWSALVGDIHGEWVKAIDTYGTPEHEAWLIERERDEP